MTEWFRLFTFAFISAGLLAVPILLLLMGDPSFFPKNAITALTVTFLAMSLIIIAVPDIVFDLGEGARKRKVRDYILSSFIVTTIVGIVVNFFTNWVTELPSYIVTPSGTAHSQSTEAPVSVSAFHLPDQTNEATNQDIRQSAYLLNQIFRNLGTRYFDEQKRITGSANQIALAQLVLEERINRDFRQTYEADFMNLDVVLAGRLKIDDNRYKSFPSGLISIGEIGNAGEHLVYLANQLQ
jgi:hypothetical protein